MKRSMSRVKGFTLIELIVVIVILGIMAAVAGPKFVNLQTDARISVAKGVEGGVRSAATLAYSRALIQSKESAASGETVDMGGVAVTLAYGYPTADAAGIGAAVEVAGNVVHAAGVFTIEGRATCTVTYAAAAALNGAPTITLNTVSSPAVATDC